MKRGAVLLAACLAWLALSAPLAAATALTARAKAGQEVFYQIFMRSFADSNGDHQGDLKGLTEKLDYIASLGVTSILLTPLQPSPFYHNYFGTAFRGVDPAFGTMADYFAFVRAAHARGLKVYLDQEFQYVGEGHPWLTESRGHPSAPFGKFILWNRPGNQEPEPFLKLPAWPVYDGRYVGIAMVDLRQKAVKSYFRDLMLYWLDPHGDGSLRDGVDGFRIDHMMDDLDNKHRLTNLFADFWAPIFQAIRTRNPDARIIAEQSDWGFGEDWLTRGGADLAFAFPLRGALTKLDTAAIVRAIDETQAHTPPGKGQIVFLENHDTDRFASLVGSDPARLRIGAALSVLLRGEPLLYYGQELGMRGKVMSAGFSDAAHIPLREAMRWQRNLKASDSAIWYAADRPWWTGRYNRGEDGVSVEEEASDPTSLLNWYRRLLALRSARPELRGGEQRLLCRASTSLLCIARQTTEGTTLVLVNLGSRPERIPGLAAMLQGKRWHDMMADTTAPLDATKLELGAMQVRVIGSY